MAYYLFEDVPPIPADQGLLNMQYSSGAYNTTPDSEDRWQPMNAANGGTRTAQGIDTHLRNVEFVLSNIERSANGFEHTPDNQKISRPQFDQPWNLQEPYPYLDRSLRYVSPGGLWGGDVSASDLESTSPSENAWSPGSSQSLNAYPRNNGDWNLYSTSSVETPCHGGIGNFPAGSGAYYGHHMASSQSNGAPVVAMSEIQQYPDLGPDVEEESRLHSIKIEFTSEHDRQPDFKPAIDDSNFCIHDDSGLGDSVIDDESCRDDGEEDEDNFSDYSPRKRTQRRPCHSTRYAAPGSPATRRSTRPKRANSDYRVSKPSTMSGRAQIKTRKSRKSNPPRPFVCSFAQYGCPSTFGSKNEWKRHVSSQHLQLGYYRCDVGQCNPETAKMKNGAPVHSRGYNDFNRKDLFTQHQRRMHCPWSASKAPSEKQKEDFENGLESVRQRCWQEHRSAPRRSVCGFCDRVFDGAVSWEERMEHVGKHYEKGDGDEREDDELREWATREGLIRQVGNGRWRLNSLKEDGLDQVKEEPRVEDDVDAEGELE